MAKLFPPINRKYFFWSIAALVLLQVVATVGANFMPFPGWLASAFNTSMTIVVALLTGVRLADAGYRFWVGVATILFLIWGLPTIGVFLAFFAFGVSKADVLSNAPLIALGVLLVVAAFIVWAGTRASVGKPLRPVDPSALSGQFVDDDEDHQRTRRVEPRF